ncbi:MFS general substrate transporter [Ganoderma sinense ZZ0214-1]|uniref:MFS general substrate transporter n=1 Tax=Ganoderma sinense ZZ0214-1 TaxID=1077348 RepID=A0A2G8ST70_9APHY|nr:MFS general substrate transporter [Ganoderma sinense ZZ0214-1]
MDVEFGGPEAQQRLECKLVRKIDMRMSILIVIYILNYSRPPAWIRNRFGLEGPTICDAAVNPVRWVHDHASPFEYVAQPHWQTFDIPSSLHDRMGHNLYFDRSTNSPVSVKNISDKILAGITRDFAGALLTRFFLGFVEAAFFPGALFLLSKWYTRGELGTRIAVLFCGNIASNAFGALMASGILDSMDGKLGQAAWRWLFYIEGSLTVFVAICAIFVLPDFPDTTQWLSDEERKIAMRRMEEDVGVGPGDESDNESETGGGHIAGLRLAVRDWKVWWTAVAMTSFVVALSFNAYFPTLSQTMGFGPTVTLLLCAPPFVFAAVVTYAVSRHSDATGERFYHTTIPIFVGIVGFVIAICTMNTAARYISLFLMAQSYAGYVVLFTWISNSFPRPQSKRAVALAFVNAFSEFGDVAGSYVWPRPWGPTYRKSYAICIATAGCTILMCYIFKLYLSHLNRKLDQQEAQKDTNLKDGLRRFRYLT